MLAIGRALVGNPLLLLVDEPSQGLAPIIVDDVYRTLTELQEHGVAILLVEQNALLALKVAERAYVLDEGRIVYDGDARQSRRPQTDRRSDGSHGVRARVLGVFGVVPIPKWS